MNAGAAGTGGDRALLERRLRGWRTLAGLVLSFERVWPALWPALGVLGALLVAALLDLPAVLPAWLHLAGLAGGGTLAIVLLVRGLFEVRLPDQAEADRRLERDSGLAHRPLSVLGDRPALGGAEGLWAAHLARSLARIGGLRLSLPRPGLAGRDPMALRALLAVALVAAFTVAGGEAPGRIGRALRPAWTPAPAPLANQLQAWMTPPAYTGLAPLFLRPEGGAVSVPAGTHLTVSVTGGSGEPALTLAGTALHFQALDASSFQAEAELTTGGRLAVRRAGHEIGGWDLTVVADVAPVVAWAEPPGRARGGGRLPATRLPWQVSHAYGVTALQAEMNLRDRPDAPALVVPIPLPGGSPKAARGVQLQDLTAHPWAGLAVTARLVARDAPGLVGRSAEAGFVLPERPFDHPVAQALMAVRKELSLHPEARQPAIVVLEALGEMSGVWEHNHAGYLVLRATEALLRHGRGEAAVSEAQQRMWDLALQLEEGATGRTAQALEAARQAVREALEAERRGEPMARAETERRMQALEDALRQHLQALAEQALRNQEIQEYDPNAHRLDTRDMRRLAEQMMEAARQGKMDEAREKMAELEQMLDEMAQMRGASQMTARERQRAQQRQQGRQQMNALQDVVQRLGTMLDHTERRRGGPGGPRQP